MALTLLEAAKQSQNKLTAGVLLAVATSDEMIAQVPQVPNMGESFVYNREKTLPTAAFVSPTHTSLAESAADFDRVTVPLRLIVDDVDVYVFAEQQQSDLMRQRGLQTAQKLKAVGRTIADKMINGQYETSTTLVGTMAGVTVPEAGPNQDSDRHGPGELFYDQSEEEMYYRAPGDRTYGPAVSTAADPGEITILSDNPNRFIKITVTTTSSLPGADQTSQVTIGSTSNEFEGLKRLVTDAQTVTSSGASGDALSFAVMDELIDLVKTRNNLRFVCNGSIRRKYHELVRSLGGTDPTHITLPGITGQVPTYRGIPILRNDNVNSDETKTVSTLSSLYLVDLDANEGFHLGVGGKGVEDAALTPQSARIMGLQVRDIGELEGKEAVRTRVSWYGASALKSTLAVARASELVTA